MGDFTIGTKSVITQSGSDEPVIASTVTGSPALGLSHATFPVGHVVGYSRGVAAGATTGNYVTLANGTYHLLLMCNQGSADEAIIEHWTAVVTGGNSVALTEEAAWSGAFSVTSSTNTIRVETTSTDYDHPCMIVFQA